MKKLLIVVDYQNDFVDGSLGFPKAIGLEQAIAAKIAEYRKSAADIIFTFDTHTEHYLDTQEGKNLPVVHCVNGTAGWNLYGKIADLKQDRDLFFSKPTFGSAELFAYLQDNVFDSIELVGLVSNICVISNAILAKTALPEAAVMVDAACTASFDEALHNAALDVMASLQIQILNR